ncbi:MAG: class I SAM-dependent methyltransferase [Balneolaceae bacterium]
MTTIPCVLCESGETSPIHTDTTRMQHTRTYHECSNCKVIFVAPDERLRPTEERARYDMHENDPDDPNYRSFLNQLFEPVARRIPEQSSGLDFGSGPGPTLHRMFEEAGHSMAIYDPFYADDPSVFETEYDFITTSETAEHLYYPMDEFERLWKCLKPGGTLGIMTSLAPDTEDFGSWHYKNDDTHVTFYRPETFAFMARQWEAPLEVVSDRVILLEKLEVEEPQRRYSLSFTSSI